MQYKKYIPLIALILFALTAAAALWWYFAYHSKGVWTDTTTTALPVTELQKLMKDKLFPHQKIYVIDNTIIFVIRSGSAMDYSFDHRLFDANLKQLCSYTDGFTGAQVRCTDQSKKNIMDTIINNLEKNDLGLTNHKVDLVYYTKE